MELLRARLAEHGIDDVCSIDAVGGGVVARAALVARADGTRCFVKTLDEPVPELFAVEAEGLRVLRDRGGVRTPDVLLAATDLLMLEALAPRRDDEAFWERLAVMVAALHAADGSERFGWHRDGWLGRLRQDNTWHGDGHAFYAQRRILRWFDEPPVTRALDADDRRAIERLCERLPELIPVQRAVLTHGDLWCENVVADAGGGPALVDPAVSYTWPEVDLSMLWCTPRSPSSERFFQVYEDVAGLAAGWRERLPVLNLRELLSTIAHEADDGSAVERVRAIVKPFRHRASG